MGLKSSDKFCFSSNEDCFKGPVKFASIFSEKDVDREALCGISPAQTEAGEDSFMEQFKNNLPAGTINHT